MTDRETDKSNNAISNSTSTIANIVKETMRKLASAVFPTDIYCICCGSIIDSTRTYSICDSCITKFQWATGRVCQKCGKPLSEEDPHQICYDCRTIPHYFDKGYTCCLYDLYARAVVMDMKYRDKSYLCIIVGDILADRMMYEPERYDLVVPVPVSKKRMDERGYNQAALIAKRFSERTEIPISEEILERSDKTIPMKDLDAMQRRLNVRGAFKVTPVAEKGKQRIERKRILLIDDIYTTGATVDECARILKEACSSCVDILTFAAGRNYVPQK